VGVETDLRDRGLERAANIGMGMMTLDQIKRLETLYQEVFGGRHRAFRTVSEGDTQVHGMDTDGGEIVADCPYRHGVADLIAEMLDALPELLKLAKEQQKIRETCSRPLGGEPPTA
jgi:hypothetical protein